MKLLFIYPRRGPDKRTFLQTLSSNFLHKVVFSPGLTYRMLAAVTPKEYSIKVINEQFQKVNFEEECNLVGITATTPIVNRAYKIADEFRKRGVKVIIGGWHSSVLPNEAKQHADSVIIGYAEEIWPKLLNDFKENKLKSFYKQSRQIDQKNIPIPDRKKIKTGFYSDGIQTTRGCSIGCRYCSITNGIFGRQYRYRDVDSIIEEIKGIPQKILRFYDPSLTVNPQFTKELFRNMIGLNKKFFCNGNINVLAKDEKLLNLASKAGCLQWSVGLESISQKNLDSIGKKTNKVDEFSYAIKKIHDYGMWVKGNFMFGFDEDYPDVFEKTQEKIHSLEIDLPCFYILTPLPGTPLFYKLEKENRILTKDWSKYDFGHVVFKPKHISPDKLFEKTYQIYDNCYSYHHKIKRSLGCLKSDFTSLISTIAENFYY